jgi:CRP-like cAMP-binding protein
MDSEDFDFADFREEIVVNYMWDNLFRDRDKNKPLRELLKKNVLFQDLNFAQISMIEKIVNVRHYRPGEPIFRQGEVGVGMYMILSGTVNIFVEELDVSTGSPTANHVTLLKAGDFFGEMTLVEHESRRSASASAQEETTLIGFFKPDLIEVVERSPTVGVKILMRLGEVLATRLRKTTVRITELKKDRKHPV